jgi:hypothetical protein
MDDQYNAGAALLTGRGLPNALVSAADLVRANALIQASADQVVLGDSHEVAVVVVVVVVVVSVSV